MAAQLFKLPDPGEGLVEADIVSWKVKVGDHVKTNDIVVEIETAKSLVELPIPWDGTILELLVSEGDTVEVGAAIVSVDVVGSHRDDDHAHAPGAGGDSVPTGPGSSDKAGEERVANLVGYGPSDGGTTRRRRRSTPTTPVELVETPLVETPPDPASAAATHPGSASPGGKVLAKPPVRKFAKDNGIDLSQVTPSGAGGIITRADVESFAASGSAAAAVAPRAPGERETRVPIKGVRKMTAQAMVGSAFTAPHVTEFVTVDMTATMDLVERLKNDREFRDVKVTPLLVLAKAMCLAVQRNPQINATWDEAAQEIVIKHYVNLGIAAATPRGLVVPNIKDAEQMSLGDLGSALGELVSTAREGKTPPADMSGGTITITNVGVFGVDTGTPIINTGEAAILAFGQVRKMPWVVQDASGADVIVPRQVTQLSLSFDHRLVDGDLGSRFLADVAALLEDPGRALVWG
ncbi:dihydrolipoamide acetyltransferase family protein [Demetria terragena]|uniref:dihydrolipoamide acetyltransferase family protein n=1 Tax=Demetria terragena TaxID=63959 RepID=UPI000366841F|nr:dihydrolipoamide acetyltransferase family protein [Demetria terragena]